MPKILDSNAYQEMENELNNLFDQIYKHSKKDRTEITSQVQQFLDNLSESIMDQSRLLFTNIPKEEIIYYKPDGSREKFQNIDEMINYFDNLSYLISFSVAQQEDPTRRVFYYDMYIQLMNFCYLKGDLSSAYAIYCGLTNEVLEKSIDRKKLSIESRQILDGFNKLFWPSKMHNTQINFKKTFNIPFIPLLPSILNTRETAKEYYNRWVDVYERIQAGLCKLDIENNQFLNRLQNDYSTWSKDYYDYMSNVYLPQSIFEYTKLLQEYEELISDHGGPIAKQFHNDENSKHLVSLVESTLVENQSVLKPSPFQNERIVEMLSEINGVRKSMSPDYFDAISYNLIIMNCASVKAEPIDEYTSKIFANLDTPHMEEIVDENPQPVLIEELQKDDVYQLHHNGMKLMRELTQAIEDRKPKVVYHIPAGPVNCGFFSRAKRGEEKVNLETMEIEITDVDVIDYDEKDLRDQTVMVLA